MHIIEYNVLIAPRCTLHTHLLSIHQYPSCTVHQPSSSAGPAFTVRCQPAPVTSRPTSPLAVAICAPVLFTSGPAWQWFCTKRVSTYTACRGMALLTTMFGGSKYCLFLQTGCIVGRIRRMSCAVAHFPLEESIRYFHDAENAAFFF
jgi:hypothetical protein